jgi:hypothetical protein
MLFRLFSIPTVLLISFSGFAFDCDISKETMPQQVVSRMKTFTGKSENGSCTVAKERALQLCQIDKSVQDCTQKSTLYRPRGIFMDPKCTVEYVGYGYRKISYDYDEYRDRVCTKLVSCYAGILSEKSATDIDVRKLNELMIAFACNLND